MRGSIQVFSQILDLICTVAEAFYMFNYADALFERRVYCPFLERHGWMFLGVPVSFYTLIVVVLNSFVLSSPYTVVAVLCLGVFFIWLLWQCDFLNAVAVAGGYLLMLAASGTVEVSMIGLLGGEELIRRTTAEQGGARGIYLFISGIYWFAVNMSLAGWLKKRKMRRKNLKFLAAISVIGLFGFLFIAGQMLASFSISMTAIIFCLLFAVSLGIFAFYYKEKSDQLRLELERIDLQNEMLERNYQQLSDAYLMNARLYHDMKHHLNALYHLADKEGQVKNYLESLHQIPVSGLAKSRSGIDLLDVILSEMEKKAEGKGIWLRMEVQSLPQDIGIEKKDMCALFANLLENALEAASKEVDLEVKYVNRMLLVRTENDYQVSPVLRNGRLQTTKEDKSRHGWGTRSIELVVEKYHGDMEYKVVREKFCVEIMLNC